jgi:hypothetical protein
MAKVCAPRVYRDGSRFRTAEPVHEGGGTAVISGIPRTAVVFMTDSATPILTGNDTFTYSGTFLNLKGNFIVDSSYLIYDDAGRTYQKSYEFKTNGHFNILDGLDPSGVYTISVELDIDVNNNLTGNSLDVPVVLGDIVGSGGKNLFIIKYKQIFNTNHYVQAVVESNYHGSFLDTSGTFTEINDTIFDTSGTVLPPSFIYENGHIKTTYVICTGLTGVEYINAYYDIEIMGSRRFVVRDWSFSILLN